MTMHALHTLQVVCNCMDSMQIKSVGDDSGEVQVNFEQDSIVSQANEYEVLQLLLADMRDRLTAYPGEKAMSIACAL